MSLTYAIKEKKLPSGSVGKITIVSGCVTKTFRYNRCNTCTIPIVINDIESGCVVPCTMVIDADFTLEIDPYPKVRKHRNVGPSLIIDGIYEINLFKEGNLAVQLLRDLCESIKRLCVMDRVSYAFTLLRDVQPGLESTANLVDGRYNIQFGDKSYSVSAPALRMLCNMMSDFSIGSVNPDLWEGLTPLAGYGCSTDPFKIVFHGTRYYRTIDVEICQAGVGFFIRLNECDFYRFYNFICNVLVSHCEIKTYKVRTRSADGYVIRGITKQTTSGKVDA